LRKRGAKDLCRERHERRGMGISACVHEGCSRFPTTSQKKVFRTSIETRTGVQRSSTAVMRERSSLEEKAGDEVKRAAILDDSGFLNAAEDLVAVIGVTACAVGISLAATSHCIFCKLPPDCASLQAEDRLYWPGQSASAVSIEILVGRPSAFDATDSASLSKDRTVQTKTPPPTRVSRPARNPCLTSLFQLRDHPPSPLGYTRGAPHGGSWEGDRKGLRS